MEFTFTDKDFAKLGNLVTGYAGIVLGESKKMLMYSRLAKRVRAMGCTSFAEYINRIEAASAAGDNEELLNIINAMTTNVTKFFREEHHFHGLKEQLPELVKKFGKVHIWSCAASTGEEPWSIAMTVAEFLRTNPQAQVTINATDLDTHVLEKAKRGRYTLAPNVVAEHPLLKKYLNQIGEAEHHAITGSIAEYEVDPKVKKLVTFGQLNLIKPFPATLAKAHVVFCRNVIIYFDKPTKIKLFEQIAKTMPEGALLCIGHSESLLGVSDAFTAQGKTMYRRNGDA